MSEQQPQPKMHGDATSQLVQLTVKQLGFAFKASGKGAEDIMSLAKMAHNSDIVAKALWAMCQDFGRALDEAGDSVPEKFRGMVCAAILNARSNMELGKK